MHEKNKTKYYAKLLNTIQTCIEYLSNKQQIKELDIKSHNPFINAHGLCWTMALGYMFADLRAQSDINFIIQTPPKNALM